MRIGVDLGGTKIEVCVLDEQGEEVYRHRVATPQGNYAKTVLAIADLVEQAQSALNFSVTRIGIGTPGAVSQMNGLMKNANSTCLNDQALLEDLERALMCRVSMANDANCFALSEAIDGAGQGVSVVFGVILGTGVGGGIVVNGKVLTGRNAISGEWGHNPLPWPREEELPGPACYCGRTGCIETWLSGPGMEADYFHRTGQRLNAQQIVNKAHAGCEFAQACLTDYEDRLARSLASVINILDPDVIVLGGGLSNITRLYQNVPKLWGRYVFSDEVNTQLLPASYGDSSGVRGAAWLVDG